MERVGIRDLNQRTSQVIERVRRGETLEVTDHGRPVARLVPVEGGLPLLERLAAEGRATPPSVAAGPVPAPPVLGDPSIDVAADIAAARKHERW